MQRIRIIGDGRAGGAMALALTRAGAEVVSVLSRHDDVAFAAIDVDVVIIATPDDAIGEVASRILPIDTCAIVHLSGSRTLEVLSSHLRRGSLHPLIPLPTPAIGAERLAAGATFAVAGDPAATELALLLGGRVVEVAEEDRARYHAAACVAANHVVALLGQVERMAGAIGLDLDCFLALTRAAVDDVAELGPGRALTGPAARGDWSTLERHLGAIDEAERSGYSAGVSLALQVATGLPGMGASVIVEDDARSQPVAVA